MDARRVLFQSPDERGGYCDLGEAARRLSLNLYRFNPLTSGAGTATPPSSFLCFARLSTFQSPDERGRVLRPPRTRKLARQLARVFNPLTSGAGTATSSLSAVSGRATSMFQSPDERGGYCDLLGMLGLGGLRTYEFQSPDERGRVLRQQCGGLVVALLGHVSIP